MRVAFVFAALLWPLAAGAAGPLDQIQKSSNDWVRGDIQNMSPTVVNVVAGGAAVDVPVNEIKRIVFQSSPTGLLHAQEDILKGDYSSALDALKNEIVESKRAEVAQEIAFCRAFCTAQLTLSGEADVVDAGRHVSAFLKNYPNSFHYYKACEVMGDLCVLAGKFDAAQQFYAKLSQAPWPDYQIRRRWPWAGPAWPKTTWRPRRRLLTRRC